MGDIIWFITILKDQPWIGFLIGLLFVSIMFGAKNFVIYLYTKNQERRVSTMQHDN